MQLLRRNPLVMFPLLSFLLLTAPWVYGQNKSEEVTSQAPTIKVHTGLVLIPAEVADSRGNRVTDLKKEDFLVFENGKRQEIALFEHVTTKSEVMKPKAVPEGVFTNTIERGPNRITIFVLDLLNSRKEEQKEARKQLLVKLEFGATARDSTGKMVGSFSKILGGRVSETQAKQVREKGILFHGAMELTPGEYEISFAVMDQVNEHTGSVAAPWKLE